MLLLIWNNWDEMKLDAYNQWNKYFYEKIAQVRIIAQDLRRSLF